MVNFKLKTIWTRNGRAPDSRDVFDKNNSGLKVGRIDIHSSFVVDVVGYSKVEYRVHLSDGTTEVFENFSAVIARWNGVDESKYGSGFMTVFLNHPTDDSLGMVQIDVYKEFEGTDPESDPNVVDPLMVKQWSDVAYRSSVSARADADRADFLAVHSEHYGRRSEAAADRSEAAADRSEAAADRSEAAAGSANPAE